MLAVMELQVAGFQLFNRLQQKNGVVVGGIGVFTSWVDVDTQANIDTRLHKAVRQSPRSAEQVNGIDLPFRYRSDFSLARLSSQT